MLADYYRRDAVAIAQVLSGYDEGSIASVLGSASVGISYGRDASETTEGRHLLDMAVRLLARVYPAIAIDPTDTPGALQPSLTGLAREINPKIDLVSMSDCRVVIGVGQRVSGGPEATIYVGSRGWDALVSTRRPRPVGNSTNPFGAGAAACLATANVFRVVFGLGLEGVDSELRFPTLGTPTRLAYPSDTTAVGDVVLVGLGAVGNSAVWALSRAGLGGQLHLVDAESVDLGNLQRYVLAGREDEGRSKVEVASRALSGGLIPVPHAERWQDFAALEGTSWPVVLTALDSARDRRAVQAGLPKWIINGWTQPGDLGVSSHDFLGPGPCLSCIYLPESVQSSNDAIYAEALGIPDQLMQVRELMYRGQGAPPELLALVAQRLNVDPSLVLPFAGQSFQTLYREGICGGAILPIGSVGPPRPDVHVPVAHQSALTGVLMSARLVARALGRRKDDSTITRVNVMRPVNPRFLNQAAGKDPRGICICQDADYQEAYRAKYR